MPRICLNMIVKNEAPVITRCLASVKPWIDHWVIVDTGSTDGTQDLVREFMSDLPGELHERPWVDFASNRNEALELARAQGDLLLFIDADETLVVPEGFAWPPMEGDGYQLQCDSDGLHFFRNTLVATHLPWRWEGVLHEHLSCDAPHTWAHLMAPSIQVSRDGARARSVDTCLRDIEVLERALHDEPDHTRYRFYLAQSCRDAGLLAEGRAHYATRATMGGWDEEVWFSLFQVAALDEQLGADAAQVREGYLKAYQMRPTRAEPLCALARFHRLRDELALAHLYAQQAAAIAYPSDALYLDAAVYAWRALDELVVSAYYANAPDQGREALRRLLAERKFPDSEQARIEGNRTSYGL
ncbi:glycosyl transferase [Variovorax sp. RO1]|uniref:tetratricopeptide repeat-containing glycosyltransferase n=1 Tax=Variovorax sp. RO1 TaxID=2066034 RepID=UPI000C716A1E|nr:glycosyltransferase [Variovorax sp. RO1]PLC04795.1 glycosyl transferase [Variovorax sp. RO1]